MNLLCNIYDWICIWYWAQFGLSRDNHFQQLLYKHAVLTLRYFCPWTTHDVHIVIHTVHVYVPIDILSRGQWRGEISAWTFHPDSHLQKGFSSVLLHRWTISESKVCGDARTVHVQCAVCQLYTVVGKSFIVKKFSWIDEPTKIYYTFFFENEISSSIILLLSMCSFATFTCSVETMSKSLIMPWVKSYYHTILNYDNSRSIAFNMGLSNTWHALALQFPHPRWPNKHGNLESNSSFTTLH